MRGDIDDYELATPVDEAEAHALLKAGYRPLAGGTDVMVMLGAGKLAHRRWVDISRLEGFRFIREAPDALEIGALTTFTELRRHPVVDREFPMLAQAAGETGGVAIQNRGTLGGNIANASPAADSAPALLAYGASVVLTSPSVVVPYERFHTGYKQTAASPGQMIRSVVLPRAGERVHFYQKVGPRRAQAISKVCFAGCAKHEGSLLTDVKIGIGGVGPTVVRAFEAERAIAAGEPIERICEALAKSISPIDDVRSTARYRRRVAENLLREFLLVIESGRHVGLGS